VHSRLVCYEPLTSLKHLLEGEIFKGFEFIMLRQMVQVKQTVEQLTVQYPRVLLTAVEPNAMDTLG
jgi:hypothetical protein